VQGKEDVPLSIPECFACLHWCSILCPILENAIYVVVLFALVSAAMSPSVHELTSPCLHLLALATIMHCHNMQGLHIVLAFNSCPDTARDTLLHAARSGDAKAHYWMRADLIAPDQSSTGRYKPQGLTSSLLATNEVKAYCGLGTLE